MKFNNKYKFKNKKEKKIKRLWIINQLSHLITNSKNNLIIIILSF